MSTAADARGGAPSDSSRRGLCAASAGVDPRFAFTQEGLGVSQRTRLQERREDSSLVSAEAPEIRSVTQSVGVPGDLLVACAAKIDAYELTEHLGSSRVQIVVGARANTERALRPRKAYSVSSFQDYLRPVDRDPDDEPPWQNRFDFSWRWIVWAVVGVLVLWGLYTSFYTVQPEERAVVKRFGAVIAQTDPGLHFKLPFGIDQAQLVPTERVLKQEFGFRTTELARRTEYETTGLDSEAMTLTGDLNIIKVEWVVQYRIADPVKWLYRIRESDEALRDVSEAVMRQIVGNRIGSDVLTVGRVEIASQARDEIQKSMDSFDAGLSIITVELQDVIPTKRVQPAFNEVNIARQEEERMINEAEKRKNQVIPRARGQANQLVAEAEGYASARVNAALGEAARFNDILAEYKQAPEVTRRRLYLEMINEALPKAGEVLVVQKGHEGPLPLLELGAAKRTTSPREGGAK